MAAAGDRFEMPDGSVYLVVTPSAETGGEYVEMEFILPPGCVAPPPHVHPSQVEEYEVVSGRFEVVVDGEWSKLGPGESASVPVGALHTFRNATDEAVHVRNWHRPAMRFEEFIEGTRAALDVAGVTGGRDPRVPMILSTSMLAYPETLAPGRRRERIAMRALATIGRLLRVT
ncbi:cupin domain-containing protein [Thermoleophilia bacterium SCSIO 60948]|nr:cupin domain-containing protein [Thermoleophilia bacterium SCSIO 60948]